MLRILFIFYVFLFLVFLNPYSVNFLNLGFKFPISNVSLFSFYPILFFPVFLKQTEKKQIVLNQFFLGCSLALFSLLYFSISFFWLGSVLIGLSFFPYFKHRFHNSGFLLFLLTPPFIDKYTLLIGFELRLVLSNLSGFILKAFDQKVLIQGNIIQFRNLSFSVDPSCEGLKFFAGVFLLLLCLQYTYSENGKNSFRVGIISFMWIFSIFLWLWANLVRILVLILFAIPGESFLHPLVGILSLLCFVGIPLTMFWFYYIPEKSLLEANTKIFFFENENTYYSQLFLLLIPILLSASILTRAKIYKSPVFNWNEAYGNFTRDKEQGNEESQFYRNPRATMILKKNLPFLGLGHHPKICFVATGYLIGEEEIIVTDRGDIRRAEMQKDGKIYFLSWWYVREKVGFLGFLRKSSEWEWRTQLLLSGARLNPPFIQVNLITNNKKEADEIYKELAGTGL